MHSQRQQVCSRPQRHYLQRKHCAQLYFVPPTAFAITNYFGQFDCNVCIALLMSFSGITPRRARLLSLMDTASSGTARQAFSTRADAFSGSSTKAPGGTTLAMNSVVVAPATTITLGWLRGGRGAARTIRTFVVAPSAQRSIRPATSCSDGVGFAIFVIEIESRPPDGLGVRASRQVAEAGGCC
jgi:hypothetical protein